VEQQKIQQRKIAKKTEK